MWMAGKERSISSARRVPASRVSMMNSAGSKVRASFRPGPLTRTRLASPISDWLIMTEMGLLGIWRPFFLMFTKCSPISLGTKEMPAGRTHKQPAGGLRRG